MLRRAPNLCAISAALALQAVASVAHGSPATAKQLFASLAKLPGLRADYREEKNLSLLVQPVVSEGKVLYARPDVFVRVTVSPVWSSLVVREKSLAYRDATGARSIPIGRNHPARAFVQVFVDVVRGDFAAINKSFAIKFAKAASSSTHWELQLRPKQESLAGLHLIKIRGKDGVIAWIEIVEDNGDHTVTTFAKVDVSEKPTAAEIKALQKQPQR